ncbi:MAG: hypothetical protein OXF65_00810 [Acidimicrobiaceae bacterium]|nr:hypothetical protein [Acidimicrobiaceae bacterium]
MTDEETPATAALAPASDATQDGAEQIDRIDAARRSRSLVIPLPTAITAALVTGMFGLLFLSLDGLRGDIGTLRDDMNSRIGETNERIDSTNGRIDTLRDDMNSRIGETNERIDSTNGRIDTLRDDMNSRIGETNERIDSTNGRIDTLRDDMNQRINALGDEIREEMTAGFREVHAVLLDHTDRLARIETHLDIRPGADAVSP